MIDGLTFDAASHTYAMRGRAVPGVSSILDPLNQLDGIPLHLLRAAGQFGKHVHMACDLWNKKQLDLPALDPKLRPYLDGWINFIRYTGAVVEESERFVFHPKLKYAGTLDNIVSWNGIKKLVDIKTSHAVPRTTPLQTAAYYSAYVAECGAQSLGKTRYCVHLTGDGKFKLHKYSDPSDFHLFVSALNLYPYLQKRTLQ
jgi:hypothetical protein